ncbi:hypothetical protein LTR81_015335 [Elasticomyces elasticus]
MAGVGKSDTVLQFLERHDRALRQRPVLLVLDNCDDARTDYRRYVTNGSQVTVILTTSPNRVWDVGIQTNCITLPANNST